VVLPAILSRVSGANQHYQPAALIGSFGRPVPTGRLREARVAVRRKATGAVDTGFPKAQKLAYRPGTYRLTSPPPGVDRHVVDKLWDPVETGLRNLTARLAGRCLHPGDDQLLFDYAAAAGVRHPSFEAVVTDHQARQDRPVPQGDEVQYTRVLALGNQRPVMPAWRWRVLHSPADAPRFMITGRGWMYVGMENWPAHGLLLPMGPRGAVLGYLDDTGLLPGRPTSDGRPRTQNRLDVLSVLRRRRVRRAGPLFVIVIGLGRYARFLDRQLPHRQAGRDKTIPVTVRTEPSQSPAEVPDPAGNPSRTASGAVSQTSRRTRRGNSPSPRRLAIPAAHHE
jgi:hypothetical protein